MPREHVYGPYKHGNRWRLEIVITGGGQRHKEYKSFATESEARSFKKAIEREIERSNDAAELRKKALYHQERAEHYFALAERVSGREMTLQDAFDQYLAYQREDRGNQEKTLDNISCQVLGIFGSLDVKLVNITERKAAALYRDRVKKVAVMTHRLDLRQARRFMEWCVSKGWIRRNPFAKVKAVGKPRSRKPQLRVDETRAFVQVAFTQARMTDTECSTWHKQCNRNGALAALVALYLGLRAGEVVNMRSRDVDDGGRLLWIPKGKSENAKRTIEIPEELRTLMWNRAHQVAGGDDDRLFPFDRRWLRDNVVRLCKLSGVPTVTAHSVRGMHATLAAESGTTAHAVARTLGHGGTDVTKRHYIQPGALEKASREHLRQVIGPVGEGAAEPAEAKPDLDAENVERVAPESDSTPESLIRAGSPGQRNNSKSEGKSGDSNEDSARDEMPD